MEGLEVDDAGFAALIVIAVLVGPAVAGFALGGFTGGISMIFLSLIVLPVILFLLGVGMFKRHDDIYG
jgi:hypothetical protein